MRTSKDKSFDPKLLIFVFIYLVGLVSGWTYTYDTDTPVGTDAPSVIDDKIREVKDGVQERQNIDHYWPLTGSQVSDADAGMHRQITFQAAITTPTQVSGKAHLYMKGDELYYQDDTNSEFQLSSAGYIPGDSIAADSIDEGEIQLANNSYLVAANAAGDGEINLIKADANNVAVLPNSTETATNAAPAASKSIVNKKYVDDQITAALPDDDAFGSWASKSNDTAYEAATDGFVTAFNTLAANLIGYTDSSNPPTTERTRSHLSSGNPGLCMPVKKGDYWKVTGASTVYWLPLGG